MWIVGVVVVLVAFFAVRALRRSAVSPLDASPPREPRFHVTFAGGDAFVTEEERREAEEDGGHWQGEALLCAIASALRARGVSVGDLVQEDWGWWAQGELPSLRFGLCFGWLGAEDGDWLLFVDPKSLRGLPEGDSRLVAVVRALHAALGEIADLRDIRWHDAVDWDRGAPANWRREPVV